MHPNQKNRPKPRRMREHWSPRPSAPIEEPVHTNPNRPRELTASPMQATIVFFDFETTGGNPQNSAITEIAAIKYVNGVEIGRFQTLVNPERFIPKTVQRITGIDSEMVRNAPKIFEVFDEFMEFIGDAFLVSHGVLGDLAFIKHHYKELKNEDYKNYYICTHLLVANFLPNIPSKTLSGVAAYFGINAGDLHRAMADAELTAIVFWKIFEVCEKHSFKTLEDLLKIQADNETLNRLGSGLLPKMVEEHAPTLPGIFYLFNPSREIVYLGASENVRKRLMRITQLSDEREFNRLIADVCDFKVERMPHYLAALLREQQDLERLNLTIDPRKFEGRHPYLIQVLIPDDLIEHYQRSRDELALHLPSHLADAIDDVLLPVSEGGKNTENGSVSSATQGRDLHSPQFQPSTKDGAGAVDLERVPLRKTRRTVLGTSASKFKINRLPKNGAKQPYTIGALSTGIGWVFGPFDPAKNPRRSFDELAAELPFYDAHYPVKARFNYLHLYISALKGRLDLEIDTLKKERSSFVNLLKPVYRYRLTKLINRIEALREKGWELPAQHLPKSGLILITDMQIKELGVYVVVKNRIRKYISIGLDEVEKLKSTRFITRLFSDFHFELQDYLEPTWYTHEVCSENELFTHWLSARKNEGEWLDFSDLEPLYKPEQMSN